MTDRITEMLNRLDAADAARPVDLRAERRTICSLIADAREGQMDARASYHASGYCVGRVPALVGAREIELRAQLVAFDAAHPEVVSKIERERTAEVDRFHEID